MFFHYDKSHFLHVDPPPLYFFCAIKTKAVQHEFVLETTIEKIDLLSAPLEQLDSIP